jgi:hypothetical protein
MEATRMSRAASQRGDAARHMDRSWFGPWYGSCGGLVILTVVLSSPVLLSDHPARFDRAG